MLIFDRPADSLKILSVVVVHGKEIGCPESLFPILVYGMKNPNEPEFLPMDIQAIIRNREGKNRAIIGMIRVHRPVLLDACEPVPAESRDTLQVINPRIPVVKHNERRLKTAY